MTAEDRRNGLGDDESSEMMELRTEVTEEELKVLEGLEGKQLASLTLWSDSLAYADENEDQTPDEERYFFDCDLYFANHQLLELYGASLYLDPEDDPVQGMDLITNMLAAITEDGGTLAEVARDDDDGLVLVFDATDAALVVAVSGWVLDTWDELPDFEEDEEEE